MLEKKILPKQLSPLKIHVFVCTNERPEGKRTSCKPKKSEALIAELRKHLKGDSIRIQSSACLDACEYGPTLVVYPKGDWYGELTLDEVPHFCEAISNHQVFDGKRIPDRHSFEV